MNAHTAGRPPHLGEGELLRLLDRDHEGTQLAEWSTHVAGCARCEHALDGLRADAATVHEWLARAAFEVELPAAEATASVAARNETISLPARRARAKGAAARPLPAWLRIAAVLVLLAAPLAAVPSLRTWVVETLGGTREPTGTTDRAATGTQNFSAAPIRFAPASGEFVVRFDAAQPRGTLRIRRGEGGDARLEIGGELPAGPVVSAQTLSIRNTTGSTASYTLELPARVTRVSIRIGDRTMTVLDARAIAAGAVVSLHGN